MTKQLKLPGIQSPMTAVFEVNFDDTMDNIAGVELAFGADDAATTTFDIFTPPPGAVVIGGRVIVKTAFDSTTNTMDLGDSDDPDRYTEAGAIDLKDADAPASGFDMLGDGKAYDGSQKVRMTILNDGAATAGAAIVVVSMVVPGRQSENLRTT
jgi:hypothetical protein